MNKKYELIIRKNAHIKSRQWWFSNLRKVNHYLKHYLPKKKLNLLNRSALTLLITNDKEILHLNKRFRKINRSTDVLSFHLKEKDQLTKKYLGDIVISTQTAKKQAKKQKADIHHIK